MSLFSQFGRWMMDGVMDSTMRRMLTDPYPENVYTMFPVLNKVHLHNMVEGAMRAQSGKPIGRPLGSPIVLSDWSQILFNPVHLFKLPTPDATTIDTAVTIGPKAQKPLELAIPIMITGMSYGGALSKKMKIALAKGASLAGTSTNTGEAPLVPEEREAAKYLIGQYNRGGWLNDDESLSQVDAIEIQLGQGAQAAAPMRTAEWMTGPEYREYYGLKPDEDSVIKARMPGVENADDFIRLVQNLRSTHGVPVGLKIAATHHLEKELAIALEAGIDYFVVDGAEAGTHAGPTILQDDVGLPTLHALARTVHFIEKEGMKDQVSIIAAGGLVNPGHFLKAIALGANAVYIGTIALLATMHTQITKALPFEPPTQLALYSGQFHEDFNIEEGAQDLSNFLSSCIQEMVLAVHSMGKTALHELDRSDLCSADPRIARICRIDDAGFPPDQQPESMQSQSASGGQERPHANARANGRTREPALN